MMESTAMSPLGNSALVLAKRGLHVFPCRPKDKRPATANGCNDATRDSAQIEAWWQQDETFNIGVATGSKSGVFVVDVDSEDGSAALARMGVMPDTITAVTANGEHFYFKMPDCDLRNSVRKIADGVDIRASGGYVLAPPSIHPSGACYAWSKDSARVCADAPDWLLDKLTDRPRERTVDVSGLMADAPEGERNDRIARLAGHLLRHRVHVEMTASLLLAWNRQHCIPPLDDDEVLRTIESICKCEDRRREHH
jgi:hypothetical protein